LPQGIEKADENTTIFQAIDLAIARRDDFENNISSFIDIFAVLALIPAPFWTITSNPALTKRATVSGTSATRASPWSLSLITPIFMAGFLLNKSFSCLMLLG
jgi:hypothetical protein